MVQNGNMVKNGISNYQERKRLFDKAMSFELKL